EIGDDNAGQDGVADGVGHHRHPAENEPGADEPAVDADKAGRQQNPARIAHPAFPLSGACRPAFSSPAAALPDAAAGCPGVPNPAAPAARPDGPNTSASEGGRGRPISSAPPGCPDGAGPPASATGPDAPNPAVPAAIPDPASPAGSPRNRKPAEARGLAARSRTACATMPPFVPAS